MGSGASALASGEVAVTSPRSGEEVLITEDQAVAYIRSLYEGTTGLSRDSLTALVAARLAGGGVDNNGAFGSTAHAAACKIQSVYRRNKILITLTLMRRCTLLNDAEHPPVQLDDDVATPLIICCLGDDNLEETMRCFQTELDHYDPLMRHAYVCSWVGLLSLMYGPTRWRLTPPSSPPSSALALLLCVSLCLSVSLSLSLSLSPRLPPPSLPLVPFCQLPQGVPTHGTRRPRRKRGKARLGEGREAVRGQQ